MPTVAVYRDELLERLGLASSFTVEDFEKLCFEFGVELDDVLDEEEAASKRQHEDAVSSGEGGDGAGAAAAKAAPAAAKAKAAGGASAGAAGGSAAAADAAPAAAAGKGRLLYYIATPANRPDLLCIEGIARGFNIFMGRMPLPVRFSAPAGWAQHA